jgi:hypothetical protein
MIQDFTKIQAHALALVAWADGSFCEAEMNQYRDFLECSPGSDSLKDDLADCVATPPDKEEVFDEFSECPNEIAATVLKNAYLMAMANGCYDQEEKEIISELAIASSVPEKNVDKLDEMFGLYYKAHQIECQIFELEG